MNRDEAILRELNLHPVWKIRGASSAIVPVPAPQQTPSVPAAVPYAKAIQAERSVEVAHNTVNSSTPLQDWPALKAAVQSCTQCRLRSGCKQTVFGVGDERADWLFVGEGPGAEEDMRGEPFVGQAGKLLDNMLLALQLRRGANVYIANVVKCRPPGNRTPEPGEIAACLPYLQRQIELIKPKIIVALGKTAAAALLNKEASLSNLRGIVHESMNTPLIVTYHPAYLLRNPADKSKAWEDLCQSTAVYKHAVSQEA